MRKRVFLLFAFVVILTISGGVAMGSVPFAELRQSNAASQAPFSDIGKSQTASSQAPFSDIGKSAPDKGLSKADIIKEMSATEEKKRPGLDWVYVAFPIFIVAGMLVYFETKRRGDHSRLMSIAKQHKMDSLKNYVQVNLKKGYSKDEIKNALAKSNYAGQEINEAFKGI